MIYRVHRNSDGYPGSPIAYVSLCHGFVDVHNVYNALLKAKLISTDWFNPEELNVVFVPTHIYGVNAASLIRRTPKKNLFYLYPIELTDQNKYSVSDLYSKVYSNTISAVVNNQSSYRMSYTVPTSVSFADYHFNAIPAAAPAPRAQPPQQAVEIHRQIHQIEPPAPRAQIPAVNIRDVRPVGRGAGMQPPVQEAAAQEEIGFIRRRLNELLGTPRR